MENGHDKLFTEKLAEYRPMIKAIIYSFPEWHREDLFQEGILGLNNAFRAYNEAMGVPFKQFARSCIKNSIYSSYKKIAKDDRAETIDEEFIADNNFSLEDSVIQRKDTESFFENLRKNLSDMESKILAEYLCDKNYDEIAKDLELTTKSVDNSLTRIKNKIKKLYKL